MPFDMLYNITNILYFLFPLDIAQIECTGYIYRLHLSFLVFEILRLRCFQIDTQYANIFINKKIFPVLLVKISLSTNTY